MPVLQPRPASILLVEAEQKTRFSAHLAAFAELDQVSVVEKVQVLVEKAVVPWRLVAVALLARVLAAAGYQLVPVESLGQAVDTSLEERHTAFQGIHAVLGRLGLPGSPFHSPGLKEGTADIDRKVVAGQSLAQEVGGPAVGELVAMKGAQTGTGTC